MFMWSWSFLKICKNNMIYYSRLQPLSTLPLLPLLPGGPGITMVPEGRRRPFGSVAYTFLVCCHFWIKLLAATMQNASQEYPQRPMYWFMLWKVHVRSFVTNLLMTIVPAKIVSDELWFKETWGIMKSYFLNVKKKSLQLSKMLC